VQLTQPSRHFSHFLVATFKKAPGMQPVHARSLEQVMQPGSEEQSTTLLVDVKFQTLQDEAAVLLQDKHMTSPFIVAEEFVVLHLAQITVPAVAVVAVFVAVTVEPAGGVVEVDATEVRFKKKDGAHSKHSVLDLHNLHPKEHLTVVSVLDPFVVFD
jgi:hypothetical protein